MYMHTHRILNYAGGFGDEDNDQKGGRKAKLSYDPYSTPHDKMAMVLDSRGGGGGGYMCVRTQCIFMYVYVAHPYMHMYIHLHARRADTHMYVCMRLCVCVYSYITFHGGVMTKGRFTREVQACEIRRPGLFDEGDDDSRENWSACPWFAGLNHAPSPLPNRSMATHNFSERSGNQTATRCKLSFLHTLYTTYIPTYIHTYIHACIHANTRGEHKHTHTHTHLPDII
jgi:hypothetical protein